MTLAERNKKLKCFITCLKCEVSGKCCDENCPTQYDAGNTGEVIENLEAISKALEQEPKEDTTFTFGQENKVALLINLDENIYKTIKRGFLDTFEIRDVREAIINGKKVIGEVTEEPKKDNFDWKENEEKWEKFKEELILETHTPITMDYDSSLKLMKSAITDTVAKWKTRIEYDIINKLEDLGMELLNALAENKALKEAFEKIKAEIKAKNMSIKNLADTHGWTNGLTNAYNAHDVDLAIIEKHTRGLL